MMACTFQGVKNSSVNGPLAKMEFSSVDAL